MVFGGNGHNRKGILTMHLTTSVKGGNPFDFFILVIVLIRL
jgi:hypothetical protein